MIRSRVRVYLGHGYDCDEFCISSLWYRTDTAWLFGCALGRRARTIALRAFVRARVRACVLVCVCARVYVCTYVYVRACLRACVTRCVSVRDAGGLATTMKTSAVDRMPVSRLSSADESPLLV